MKTFFIHSIAILMIAAGALGPPTANAQTFEMNSYTVSGGGGFSAGGSFDLGATIGQPHAGTPMSGGSFDMTSGFWVASSNNQGPVIVTPQTLEVIRGEYVAGGIQELSTSDNADLTLRRSASDIQSRTEFIVKGVSPVATPRAMEVTLEGAVFARSVVNQAIDLYNYDQDQFEQVDERPASRFADATAVVVVTGNADRFVQPGTNTIEARVRYQSVSPRQVFASNTDMFIWTID